MWPQALSSLRGSAAVTDFRTASTNFLKDEFVGLNEA